MQYAQGGYQACQFRTRKRLFVPNKRMACFLFVRTLQMLCSAGVKKQKREVPLTTMGEKVSAFLAPRVKD